MLKVSGLTISFPDQPPAVNDLSFELEAGHRLGLLGLSGSGKSLTALALLGLLPPTARIDAGEAWYQPQDGAPLDLLRLNGKEWRKLRGREISLVFQEPLTALNPVQTTGDQLLEAARYLCPELTTAAARLQHINEWLRRVELPDDQERILLSYPHQLSGGQRQRLLIALALLGAPRLLIADEPTTALDTITEAGILRLLEKLRTELGMTTIFITHDLNVMARSADDLLVMKAGQAVRQGPAEELLKAGENVFNSEISPISPTGAPHFADNNHADDAESSQETTEALSVNHLTISYPVPKTYPWSSPLPKSVVNDVSFSLQAGEWLAIVGPSGCGKTSIARCLSGLLPATEGSVELGSRGSIQLVFQDPFSSLNPAHTIRRAIMEVLRIRLPGKKKATYEQEAGRFLDQVGLPADVFAERRPQALSGGQRQRVAIARALAANPTVLIADEAVSALDVPLRKDILDLLDTLRREQGIALLFITHDLKLVADRADRVIIMEDGRIVEQGAAKAIFAAPASPMGKRLVAAGA
ncbi:ABC transporter ATP-binding protein [Neolewinella aurantiaca]|uniref:ABC transporter ATP-binding protein n=1 Tax=Neolewinella aurantiaca TaxID=2602767 RepID=A0A5C7FXT2_9BACT|nr:ABC transporter ATP-binding protein [Neolewinella aurantiaca]TXF91621.1 ABC transporter ATP-binding protein [Neolewinella aurantiaca]